RWIGGELIVVQTGDQLDRGDQEQAILDLFERLRIESKAAGGAFHALLGNHEIMNARGDLRYVTDGGFADFMDAVEYDPGDSLKVWDRSSRTVRSAILADFEPHQRARMAALMPGGPYADLLAQRQVILRVGDNVFVHGGVLPDHVAYGIDEINSSAQAWLRGEADLPPVLQGSESPQWTRLYSRDPDSLACGVLEEALTALEAKRIVMGHTIQESGITSACGARAWRIDVAMAAYYGGSVEVLEIVGDSVRVLKDGG
ncbi:MAG: metallophosphoesterase, partial [Gemmatimonadetes bacterium]|nr:metallophosphoesterase [Gemmatimonadota bacterium]